MQSQNRARAIGDVPRTPIVRVHDDIGRATVNGVALPLTAKHFKILQLLSAREGQVVSKDGILSWLYPETDPPEASIIEVLVCGLRKRLAEAGAPNVIGTVWGRGYIMRQFPGSIGFVAEVPPGASVDDNSAGLDGLIEDIDERLARESASLERLLATMRSPVQA